MANFDTSDVKANSLNQATSLLNDTRSLYTQAKSVQSKLALYQAGTDPAFNAAINALFSAAERTQLGQMLAKINDLVTDWEANHRLPLKLP